MPKEMLACGLPCVELAGVSAESIFGSDGPLELAPLDPSRIADALERLLVDKAEWERRSREGIEFVASHTWEHATDEVEAGLRAALRARRTRLIPFHYPHGPSTVGTLCLHIGGHRPLVFYGQTGAGVTTVSGQAPAGSPSILYYRRGRESWWQLLGALDFRFGLGKAAIFGDWTLPAVALAVLALWFAVVRLLVRELK